MRCAVRTVRAVFGRGGLSGAVWLERVGLHSTALDWVGFGERVRRAGRGRVRTCSDERASSAARFERVTSRMLPRSRRLASSACSRASSRASMRTLRASSRLSRSLARASTMPLSIWECACRRCSTICFSASRSLELSSCPRALASSSSILRASQSCSRCAAASLLCSSSCRWLSSSAARRVA